MVAAIAFACIRSDGMSVRRVEFTPEFKVCLPFLRFAGLGDEPLDTAPIEEDGAVRAGVEQHFASRTRRLRLLRSRRLFPSDMHRGAG